MPRSFNLSALIGAALIGTALVADIPGPALSADMAAIGDVTIHQPWARASLGKAPNSGAYMTLETMGSEPDRLVGAASPVAARVELHTHLMEDGIARMRQVEAIEVAPGAPTVLEPGGLHVMLMGLQQTLEEGGTMPLTLTFETAGDVTLEVPIKGVSGMAAGGHGAMQHGTEGHSN